MSEVDPFEKYLKETDDDPNSGPMPRPENCDGCGQFVAWKDYTEEHHGGLIMMHGKLLFADRWFCGHRAGTGCRKDEVSDD